MRHGAIGIVGVIDGKSLLLSTADFPVEGCFQDNLRNAGRVSG
jgi:hypothetical protein